MNIDKPIKLVIDTEFSMFIWALLQYNNKRMARSKNVYCLWWNCKIL